jgi:hypothetical protein
MFKKRKRKKTKSVVLSTESKTDTAASSNNVQSIKSVVSIPLPIVTKLPPTKRRALLSHQSTSNESMIPSTNTLAGTTYVSDRLVQPRANTSGATAERQEDGIIGSGDGKKTTSITSTKSTFGKSHGPMRASSNVRTTTRFDYDPSICKDYKETGTCGYGDSCIYLHDRSDYKSGAQIEKEYNDSRLLLSQVNQKKGSGGGGSSSSSSSNGGNGKNSKLPFACYICRKQFKRPVVSRCQHYFCESCALNRFIREKKRECAVCGVELDGNFSVAKEIISHIHALSHK